MNVEASKLFEEFKQTVKSTVWFYKGKSWIFFAPLLYSTNTFYLFPFTLYGLQLLGTELNYIFILRSRDSS